MYAAAGGASLASRQARKKQAQQNTKNKATNQLILREKLAAKAASTPTKSKAFHQLPASYLRAPHQHHRKLSAGYTSIPGSDQQHPHHKFAFGPEQPCTSGTAHGPHGPPHPAIGHAHHHHHHHHHHHPQAGGAAAVGSPHASGICHVHGAGAHGPAGLPTASGASFPPMPRATGFREYDRLARRQQLTKSATATLPLVSQAQSDLTPPDTPTLGFPGADHHHHHHGQQQQYPQQQHHHPHELTQQQQQLLQQQQQHQHQQHPNHHFYHYSQQPLMPGTKRGSVPVAPSAAKEPDDALTQPLMLQIPNDPIIITPATPQATPPGRLALKPLALTDDEEAVPLTGSPTPGALERKCSVYRGRKLDPYEEQFYTTTTGISGTAQHQYQADDVFFPPTGGGGGGGGVPNGGGGHSTTTTTPGHQQAKWDADYYCCECDHRQYGVCTCDQFECAQGRAAWLERGRRCSVQETPASCHRRWVKRNRIQDSSLGGSSDDEDLLGVLRGPSSFANAFLYVGLGTIAIGLVIAFVGTGEKGFKTVELRLIGPSLIGLGLFCCILRILFCICPSHCISSSRRAREKKNAKIDADHRTSLLRGDSKRVSIARGPHIPTKQPQIYPKSIVKAKTYEGVEALRQIATTSLFLQNEQKVSSNRIVPIIKEPEKLEEPPLELKRIDPTNRPDNASIVSISDGEDDSHRRPHPTVQHRNDTQVIDLTGEDNEDDAQDQDEQSHSPNSSSGGTINHQRKDSKLRRQRTSVNQQQKPGTARELQSSAYGGGAATGHDTTSGSLLMETSLMIIGPTPISSPTKSIPVPQQQQQQQQQQQSHPPFTVVSTQSAVPSSSLTIPALPANGSAAVPLGSTTKQGGAKPGMAHPVSSSPSTLGGNLLSLPSTSQGTSLGAAGFGSTPLPGQLSPLPSTSYLSSAMTGGYRTAASSSTSPLPGFIASPHFHHHHNTSSSTNSSSNNSSTSNYIFSPPPFATQHEPITRGTNTITTASPLLHPAPTTVTVNTTKTEPELVLSPAKLGQ
ncbi:uncharacterized protein LOC126571785 [Anopheles aquasalis]|uniref:uncharacterized protein LOC126571785 n=1 Tax=Anopheles aquasalis TaxID=42839 RepID=UPI00215A26F4|nr:uncharacterized protein LOC126571785 [Anopheles aquasalis]